MEINIHLSGLDFEHDSNADIHKLVRTFLKDDYGIKILDVYIDMMSGISDVEAVLTIRAKDSELEKFLEENT